MEFVPFKIYEYPNPILKKKAVKVHKWSFELNQTIRHMVLTLAYHTNGIGLCSIQVGVPESIIMFWSNELIRERKPEHPSIILNAEIINASDEIVDSVEGCLSLPGVSVPVKRHKEVTIRGNNYINLHEFEETYTGQAAIIVQHEIDHLNGLLLFDKISKLKKQMYAKKLLRSRKYG